MANDDMPDGHMRLMVMLPTEVLIDAEVVKVIAEAGNGFFCLLPRHVDFLAALVPGILYYSTGDGVEHFVAVDEGTLIKCGHEVRVSVMNATAGARIDTLQAIVLDTFRALDDEERRARTTLARLEAGTMRRFLELEKDIHGG
jgi:F-type H+-transporting ATPase subunit epsilon